MIKILIFRISCCDTYLTVAVVASIFISLKDEFTPYQLFSQFTHSLRNFFVHILLIQFIGCYVIYMMANAVLEFKRKPISFKILYIFSAIIIVILNGAMIADFITSKDKIDRVRSDSWADSLALLALFFTIADFFVIFIKKKGATKNKKSHQYNTDDYKEVIPGPLAATPPRPTSP
jgi:hypothetical protein